MHASSPFGPRQTRRSASVDSGVPVSIPVRRVVMHIYTSRTSGIASFSELSGLTGLLYKHRCLKNGFRSSQQLPTRSVAAGWLMAFGVTLSARQWSALAVGNRTKAGDHQREHSCMVLWWIPPPCPQRPDLMAILESLQLLGPKRSRDCKFIATCAKWQEKN